MIPIYMICIIGYLKAGPLVSDFLLFLSQQFGIEQLKW